MSMKSAFRISKKTMALNKKLSDLHNSPAARPLPPTIASLALRYKGIKGNATLSSVASWVGFFSSLVHWAREELPGLKWANPELRIIIEEPITPGSTPANLQSPGITINLTDSTNPVFYPVPPTIRSQNVTPDFLRILTDPEALEKLRSKQKKPAVQEAPPSASTGGGNDGLIRGLDGWSGQIGYDALQ
ncbi:BQ2448_1283 [Microbotryum intermedium]|uniref:BQ2448_1283 protein n=1 Tax=Microbotryum intermedium TaxID=269621 RepID=A0A238FAT4_9BASI|nr:BQ2448_1283 [Microbotryum intermedium]